MKSITSVKKNNNQVSPSRTLRDYAAEIRAAEKSGEPFTNRRICQLWIEVHCAPPRSQRINFEMTSEAYAHDVRRWAEALTGRHYVIEPGDFCFAAITGLRYAWEGFGEWKKLDAYYFAMYPRRGGMKA